MKSGWTLLIAGLATMLTLLAGDVAQLKSLHEIDPAFLAGVLAHLGAVLAAFAGGKLQTRKERD